MNDIQISEENNLGSNVPQDGQQSMTPAPLVNGMSVAEKLAGLRAAMSTEKIDALIVDNADPHGNEYVAPRWCCRQWLTEMKGRTEGWS